MSAKTYNKMNFHNLLGLHKVTTEEMFNLSAMPGDIIFNSDIQQPCYYSISGWKDMSNNDVLQRLFWEDFESGNFSANNWNVVDDTDNVFIVGEDEAYHGNYSAYISNNNLNAEYENNKTQISHFWKEIILPDSPKINLDVIWKAVGENNYDYGRIYILPTTITPQAHQLPDSQYLISGDLNGSNDWQKSTFDLSTYKNSTIRLCHTWRNDSSVGTNPGICFDNILISHQ